MSTAKYTPMDRLAVHLWSARMALGVARAMLKRPEHRAEIDRLLTEIHELRATVKRQEVTR